MDIYTNRRKNEGVREVKNKKTTGKGRYSWKVGKSESKKQTFILDPCTEGRKKMKREIRMLFEYIHQVLQGTDN